MLTRYRWGSMTPLRQFKGVPQEVIRKAEAKQFVSASSTVAIYADESRSRGTGTLIS
jgi:hypothetical protein